MRFNGIMDALEHFFNWQSDMDWAWGPLLFLRPPRDAPIRPWVWVRLFLAFTLLGVLLLGLLAVLCVFLPKIAVLRHQRLPDTVEWIIEVLRLTVHDPALTDLICLALSLPALFFAFCLPYHWAWNRRAARLRKARNPMQKQSDTTGVWPPAPTVK